MLVAYAAGEQIIGRQIIEEVADNLDLLPRNDTLLAMENTDAPAGRVLTPEAREELWNPQSRVEANKPKMFQTAEKPANGKSNGKSNGNGAANGKKPFDDLDDDVSLEIEEVGGFY